MPDHDQELDYRPSVKLAPHEELGLLDEALEEAKARPRPPQVSYAAPPVPVRPRAIAAAVNPPPVRRRVEDLRSNDHWRGEPEIRSSGLDDAFEPYESGGRADGDVDREPVTRRQRVDIADILAFSETTSEADDDADHGKDGAPVDRKRLLAAIICILHEELSRSK